MAPAATLEGLALRGTKGVGVRVGPTGVFVNVAVRVDVEVDVNVGAGV